MELQIQGLLFLGIIPALFLLYISLKGYEGTYKEKSIFLTFIIGIVFGVIAAIVRFITNPLPALELGIVNALVYVIIYALFEQLFKTIILNMRRLQGKKEAVIYGLSLGLGFGSSFTPFLVILGSLSSESNFTFVSIVTFGSLGFILLHAATSAYIGYGVYRNKLMKFLLLAIMIQLPFNFIVEASRYYSQSYHVYLQAGLVIYGLIVFWYVIKYIVPQILKDKNRKRTKKTKTV